MDPLQQNYWAQHDEAVEMLQHGRVQEGLDLCLDLRRKPDMNLFLRALVFSSLAIYFDDFPSKTLFAQECLDLASMMHDKAPDEETEWLLESAQNLVKEVDEEKEEAEKKKPANPEPAPINPNIEIRRFESTNPNPGYSWEGQFTKHWKAAKEREREQALQAAQMSDTLTTGETKGGIGSPSREESQETDRYFHQSEMVTGGDMGSQSSAATLAPRAGLTSDDGDDDYDEMFKRLEF